MSLGSVRVRDLLHVARGRGASDLHLGTGDRPALRVDGRLIQLDAPPIDADGVAAFLHDAFAAEQRARFELHGHADAAAPLDAPDGPYRVHAYRHAGGTRVAIRLLAASIPDLDRLGLPAIVGSFAQRQAGLVIFAGPTGSGKTTALAALVDRINRSSERNVLTIEDPVEYLHRPVRSLITHCEVGRDVADYPDALCAALRADPDVLLIGELREPATMAAALAAAETGHLVLTTLHTADAAQSIERVADAFAADAHALVRAQLASVLVAVVALRLLPRRGGGRRAATEILVATDAVRALIREGKAHQIRNAIVTGRANGMQTLEGHLAELVMHGEVELADARSAAPRPEEIRVA